MKNSKLRKMRLIAAIAVIGGIFLFCEITNAIAGNIGKPLHTWAQTQVAVSNSDFDNVVHIDISYNLNSLWNNIVIDGTINLGVYHSLQRVHEVTYFWVVMYSIDDSAYVAGDEGMGKQRIGGYYWGLFAQADGSPLHCHLTVPEGYGTGQYRVEVLTRLGTWDWSYVANDGTVPTGNNTPSYLRSSPFTVNRFESVLPIASGTMENPDSDSTIVINIPAYSTFTNYNPTFPPSFYEIEISESTSFPWSEPPESPRKTVYAYPVAKNEAMTVYMRVDSLNHSKSTFYGRIRCLGPSGQNWTERVPTTIGNVSVTYWTTRLPAVTNYSVANIGEDTTVEVTITRPNYNDFASSGAQPYNPKVNIYLVHDSVYTTYQNNKEKIMEVIYDPTHADYDKIRVIPVEIKNPTGPIVVNAEVPFVSPYTGTYHVCARSSADGFTPGAFTATWQATNIQVNYLTSRLAAIPSTKWSIDNTGADSYISVSINHYSEFIGTSDMHSAYEVKVTSGTKIGYAYVNIVTTAGQKTIAYIDLTKVSDGGSGIVNFVTTVPKTITLTVRCVKDGMTPGAYSTGKNITVNSGSRLQNPSPALVNVVNEGNDRVITVTIKNYDPVNLGKIVPAGTLHRKDTRHTGYQIDIAKDDQFEWGNTFHLYHTNDLEGDGTPDEIKGSNPDGTRLDIDLDLAREDLGDAFIDGGGTVYVRVLATRDRYAVNYENLPVPALSVSFRNVTRLENPNSRAAVYNSEPGNPVELEDRTITVEVENYDPSGIKSGINLKDEHHAGYQIDISSSSAFTEGETYHHYYIYDSNGDGEPDEISSSIPGNLKIHIDLDLCRDIWPDPESGELYVRVLALRPGYAVNYEDLPAVPFIVPYTDRSLLAKPSSVTAENPANPNSGGYSIDSSILVNVGTTTPTDVVHEGYAIKIDLIGADGKTYSRTYYDDNLVLSSDGPIPGSGGDVESKKYTIDIKKLFEPSTPDNRYDNLLANFIGVPVGSIKEITLTIVSTKPGYTSTDPIEATYPDGSLNFKNTSESFLPEVSSIEVENGAGSPALVTTLGPYPTTPSTIPDYADDMHYQIDYSTDPAFPWDTTGTVTQSVYGLAVPAPGETPQTYDYNVSNFITTIPTTIYVRARLIKDGYTAGPFTAISSVEVTVLPPQIIDFTATPTSAKAGEEIIFRVETSGEVDYYTWYFGDGETGMGAPTVHIYSKADIYSVSLRIEGPGGFDDAAKLDYITIFSKADFDRNGGVDWLDFKVFSAAWPSSRGAANYNPDADFNDSGTINNTDYAIFCNEWNPRPPSGLAAQAAPPQQAILTWEDNTEGESRFKLERSVDSEEAFTLLAGDIPQNTTSYIDSTVTKGHAYYYRVYAAGSGFRGTDYSNVTSIAIPPNRAPVAYDQAVYIDEDMSIFIILKATDQDNDALTHKILTMPSHGTLSTNARIFCYTPRPNYYGSDSFAFKVNDGTVDSEAATVSITVDNVNDPPVISNLPSQFFLRTVSSGLRRRYPTILDLNNYVKDVDNFVGEISWTADGNEDIDVYIDNGRAIISADDNWTGSETVLFTATDPDGLSDSAQVTFNIGRDIKEIQEKIDMASPGDEVMIDPATYIFFDSNLKITKDITLTPDDGDPDHSNPDDIVFILGDYHILVQDPDHTPTPRSPFGELGDVTIDGVTITGYAGQDGKGPIQNYAANLTLKNCKIMDNVGTKVSAIYSYYYAMLNLDNTLIARNRNFPKVIQTGYGSYTGDTYCGTIYLEAFAKIKRAYKTTIADNTNEIDSFIIQTGYGGQTGYGAREIPIDYGAIYRYLANYVEISGSILWNNEGGKDISQRYPICQRIDITKSDIEQLKVIGTGPFDVIHVTPEFDDAYVPQNPDPRLSNMGARQCP